MTRKVHADGMQTYEIVDSIWFPLNVYSYADKGDLNVIGIVKVKDQLTGEIRCYIGAGKGEDLKYDEQLVAACGSPFNAGNHFDELYTLMRLKEK